VHSHRGTPRDGHPAGLANYGIRRRTEIAYNVEDEKISVIGVFHGGRDYEAALLQEDPEE